MNPEGHFPKSTFAYQLDKFVVIESGGRYLIVLFDIGFYELDDFVTLTQNVLVKSHFTWRDW